MPDIQSPVEPTIDKAVENQPDESEQVESEQVESEQGAEEYGGPKGREPTRYGDWEKNGRCIDF
jgi:hypothetical protein